MPLLPWLIATLGWKQAFVLLMTMGFVWAAAWWFWFRDEPAEQDEITAAELAHILATRQKQPASTEPITSLTAGRLLRSGNLWLMMGQYFASNFTFFFCL